MIEFLIDNNLNVLLLAITTILILGIFYVRKLNITTDRKLDLVISITAGLSIILVAYNLIINTHSNDRIEQNRIDHITLENIQLNWLSPQIELAQNYPEGYFLFKSMNPDSDHLKIEPTTYDTIKRSQIEIISSIRIFQAMEDFLTLGHNDLTSKHIWTNRFIMWLQSPILRTNWSYLSKNYSEDTRDLINDLIIESDKLIKLRTTKGKLSNDDYDSISINYHMSVRQEKKWTY